MRTLLPTLIFCAALPVAHAGILQGTPSTDLSPVFGTLVNFDNFPSDTVLNSTDYASVGVQSIAELNGFPIFYLQGSQSPPNYIATGADANFTGDFLFTFTDPADRVGIGIAGPNTSTLTVRDANGTVLESDTVNVDFNSYFVISTGAFNIHSLEVSSDVLALDDLQFESSAGMVTPEPVGFALTAAGLASLLLLRRYFFAAASSTRCAT